MHTTFIVVYMAVRTQLYSHVDLCAKNKMQSPVSRHRRARRWPRAPPAVGSPMSARIDTTFEQGCDKELHGHPEI